MTNVDPDAAIPRSPAARAAAQAAAAAVDAASAAPHRPADDSEEVYYEGSPLLRGVVGKGILWELIGLVLIAGAVYMLMSHRASVPWYVPLAAGLIGIVLMFVPVMQAKSIRYRISNYRIDYERGLLGKSIDTLELWHVEDLKFNQSLLDRILGVGTITVISHDDTTPLLTMHGIPTPRPLFETLKQRIISVKRQRGVVKMDVGN